MSFTNHTTTFLCMRENIQRRQQQEDVPLKKPALQFELPPVWVDSKEACETIVEQIKTLMAQLSDAHASRLVVRMDDSNTANKDREIDRLTKEATKRFRLAEIKIKEIVNSDAQTASDADLSVRVNVQRNLAQTLQDLSMEFRKSQREYMNKLKSQKQATQLPSFLKSNSSEQEAFLLADDDLAQRQQEVGLEEERRMDSKRLRERDEEVVKIARSIEELGTIFKHLSNLIIEQGSILDRIDQNMDLVVDRTQLGVRELEIADQYRNNNRANYCVLILTIFIFIFFVVLMNKLE